MLYKSKLNFKRRVYSGSNLSGSDCVCSIDYDDVFFVLEFLQSSSIVFFVKILFKNQVGYTTFYKEDLEKVLC